jgi:hypothetical protein
MRHFVSVALTLGIALASTAAADVVTITTDPAQPVAGSPFKLIVDGEWFNSCIPADPRLFFAGRSVVVDSHYEGGNCLSVMMPFQWPFDMPALDSGTYHVEVRTDAGGVESLSSADITVSGEQPAASIGGYPIGGTAGGTWVTISGSDICSPGACDPADVFFGDARVTSAFFGEWTIEVLSPPHAEGTVDITVRRGAKSWTARAAHTYVSPALFDRVLFPLIVPSPVPGGWGSSWISSTSMMSLNPATLNQFTDFDTLSMGCNIGGCPPPQLSNAVTSSFDPAMPGLQKVGPAFFYVRKPASKYMDYALRIQDVSRQSLTWGTSIPVIREADWSRRPVQLLHVPLDGRFRLTLRIYSPQPGQSPATIRIYDEHSTRTASRSVPLVQPPLSVARLPRYGGDEWTIGSPDFPLAPAYAEIDGFESIPEIAGMQFVRVEVSVEYGRTVWAFMSVGNNETQHVTVIPPN